MAATMVNFRPIFSSSARREACSPYYYNNNNNREERAGATECSFHSGDPERREHARPGETWNVKYEPVLNDIISVLALASRSPRASHSPPKSKSINVCSAGYTAAVFNIINFISIPLYI